VIGISSYLEPARWSFWDRAAALVPRSYVDGVAHAGGVPVLLPPLAADGPSTSVVSDGAVAAVQALDGLVLSGGADVDPARYGEQRQSRTVTSPERDGWEFALLRAALELGTPVLAICRGMQLLDVACGGTLHQHLPDAVGHDGHRPGLGEYGRSSVRIAPASRLAGILGTEIEVSCHHHQAVRDLGDGLVATAWTDDDTVEAIEHSEHDFVVGVQWHPEEDQVDRRLFEALVRAGLGG
jgi:gamma-glutamyl-gamma-aminobutyrate hydrolase PuuD